LLLEHCFLPSRPLFLSLNLLTESFLFGRMIILSFSQLLLHGCNYFVFLRKLIDEWCLCLLYFYFHLFLDGIYLRLHSIPLIIELLDLFLKPVDFPLIIL